MDLELAKEIIACLPQERTLYHYHKGRYAVDLLRRYLADRDGLPIARLKASPYGRLLEKPLIKSIISQWGQGVAKYRDLDSLWDGQYETYVLTLGTWGGKKYSRWDQLSRPGGNLVLQMNFSNRHNLALQRCGFEDPNYFNNWGHPVSPRRCTLAWARIDLDFETDEALVEEVQSDWVRDIDELREDVQYAIENGDSKLDYWGENAYVDRALEYLEGELGRHLGIWSEAMLNATLQFLTEELGLKSIYYHSFETGTQLKNINYSKPPRSLYSDLPKQFCFQKTEEAPEFLARDKHARRVLKKVRNLTWFRLAE
ncbi:MAG: hypothetical protein AAGA91_19740 [Pseudomonadota bacterium]